MPATEAGIEAGARLEEGGVRFSVWSGAAERVWLCLFDGNDRETDRIEMATRPDGMRSTFVAGAGSGQRYGLRADGNNDPVHGWWFDPSKLLVDPNALAIDRPYRFDPRLSAAREARLDTAPLMPKAVVSDLADAPAAPARFREGGLIYEINVRGFSMLHPQVPQSLRGTVGALAHPAIVEHLTRLGVDAVELMPIVAWMDERHLPPLGLSNAWGYNPVTFGALDPRLVPGGWAELRSTVETLHEAGIGVILDLVFNHTAESDAEGPTLSLRGLDNRAYFRHDASARLVNDTGCGNTLACDHPAARRLVMDCLRSFVRQAGVDGFRFDLATVLGRTAHGFDAGAELLREIMADPVVGSRVLIAEPWDIGPGGYRLGGFPPPFLEWNDRCRDDLRHFWRGDEAMVGALATRLSGSSDIFGRNGARTTRTVNFLAAHDGKTLADLVSYVDKHNHANGEDNRDGHDHDIAWNHGVEGPSDDAGVRVRRRADVKALLAVLFSTRGTIMLTAGDEFGRTQRGNNNAYAQDNELTWLDWSGRDREMEAFAADLSALRGRLPVLGVTTFLDGAGDVAWLRENGRAMTVADWEEPSRRMLAMVLEHEAGRLAVAINAGMEAASLRLPGGEANWMVTLASAACERAEGGFALAPRSVAFLESAPAQPKGTDR